MYWIQGTQLSGSTVARQLDANIRCMVGNRDKRAKSAQEEFTENLKPAYSGQPSRLNKLTWSPLGLLDRDCLPLLSLALVALVASAMRQMNKVGNHSLLLVVA